MKKKGYIDYGSFFIVSGIISAILLTFFIIGAVYVNISNRLDFNRQAGGYCHLAYSASDIIVKVDYYDKCYLNLKQMDLQGYSVWFFTRPDNYLPELYKVADSLSVRMHDLLTMDKSSFEYQTGLQQVEDELAYFIGKEKEGESSSNDLGKFERAYCFENHMKIFCV